MSGFDLFLAAFHVLRPWVLGAFVPLAWIWWRHRAAAHRNVADGGMIAPHLARALTVGGDEAKRGKPIDLVALMLGLLIFAASGPTWSRVPDPFAAQSAPLVVVMQVTPSMQEMDVAPSRLARAKQKTSDLLHLRVGARTALVAYAGTAHSVVPMTEDPGVMQPYLEGLSPDIMPREGRDIQAAYALARQILARETTSGGILFLIDDLPAADMAALAAPLVLASEKEASDDAAQADNAVALAFLFLRPEGQALPDVPRTASVQSVTPDGRDIERIESSLAQAYARAQLADGDQPWQDRGAWFAWPAALLMLLWFRRGVVVRWVSVAVVAAIMSVMVPPSPAQAEGWRDWFLTPDQQGWLAFEDKEYARAAETFADPYLRGIALYRGGQYEMAAETMSRIDTAQAAFVQGMAHIKSRGYRDGVRAFERALDIDPQHAGARANLPVSEAIVAYVETAREQSDTGEDAGIGADDVVFDNEAAKGVDTEVEAPEEEQPAHLSSEQWMNTVDTRTSEFLRQRFLLETARSRP